MVLKTVCNKLAEKNVRASGIRDPQVNTHAATVTHAQAELMMATLQRCLPPSCLM
jgi:hypothetical protein